MNLILDLLMGASIVNDLISRSMDSSLLSDHAQPCVRLPIQSVEFVDIISVGHSLNMCGCPKDKHMALLGHFGVKMQLSEVRSG